MKFPTIILIGITIAIFIGVIYHPPVSPAYAAGCSSDSERATGCACRGDNKNEADAKCWSNICQGAKNGNKYEGACVGRADYSGCSNGGQCASGFCTDGGVCRTYTPCLADRGRPNSCSCNDGGDSKKCASGYCTTNNENGVCTDRPAPYVYVPPPKISSSCQIPATDILFVMDTSRSMKNGDLNRAVRVVEEIAYISEDAAEERKYTGNIPFRMGLVVFDSNSGNNHNRGIIQPLTTNYELIREKIYGLWPDWDGGTCLECGLDNTKNENDALGAFKSSQANTRKIVIILTDANITRFQDTDGTVKGDATDQMRRRAEDSSFQAARRLFNTFNGAVQFYVINYGETKYDDFLTNMVSQYNPYYGQGKYLIEASLPEYEIYKEWSHIIGGGIVSPGAYDRSSGRGLVGWPINLSCFNSNGVKVGSTSHNTGSFGWFDFANLADATYSFNIPAQAGYIPVSGDTRDNIIISKGNEYEYRDLPFAKNKSIKGCVYIDTNANGVRDNGETYSGNPSISISPASTGTFTADGCFSFSNLTGSYYTVKNSPLPSGYQSTFPVGLSTYYISFNSANACTFSSQNSAGQPSCLNGNAIDVNFGITNATPWIQTNGFDIRIDSGISNNITASPPTGSNACGGVMIRGTAKNGAGVVYSGNYTATFGQGKASDNNWVVSNLAPDYRGGIKTSYTSMSEFIKGNKQPITTMTNECNRLLCTITSSTFANKPYLVEGNFTINNATISNTQKLVIFVNGDVTINGPITVPTGGFFMIIAKGNVTIGNNVGALVPNRYCAGDPSMNPQIQAIISTDKSIFVQGGTACPTGDKQLNIAGSLITNAALAGGDLVNSRNLCGANLQYPSLTIQPRLDFLLNAPSYILRPTTSWQEVAP